MNHKMLLDILMVGGRVMAHSIQGHIPLKD
jgi:hypothetical protein